MDNVLKGQTDALFLFFYLLPGFLGSLVYDFLVEGRKRGNFERVIAALVLTLVSWVILNEVFKVPLLPLKVDDKTTPTAVVNAFVGRNLLYESLLAIAVAVLVAVLNNARIAYWVLNRLRITTKASSVDVWADTFDRYRGFWIGLRFADGRLLIGWPRFYSQFGDARELFLAEARWMVPDGSGTLTSADVQGPGVYIADFSKIEAIEVLNGKPPGQPASATGG
jgi:hypothetical protein